MISTICLSVNTAVCLLFSFLLTFRVDILMAKYEIPFTLASKESQLVVRLAQTCGTLMFIMAFIIGHMIPKKDKHQAAVRTCMMLDTLLLISTIYSAHYDDRITFVELKTALTKNIFMFGGLTLLSFISMFTVSKPKSKTQ